jgi:SEC-C motif-containing protein
LKISVNAPCSCKSGKKYKKCCKTFHEGNLPKTAHELMRSRYCAFAINNTDYIINTTHPLNSDFTDDKASWAKDISAFSLNTQFNDLEILDFIDGEVESFVIFKASLIQNGNDSSFCEKSRFLKEDGKWLYVNGEFL